MKNRKLRTVKQIQEHNRMTSTQRLKHQYNWNLLDWLMGEHRIVASLLALAPFIALVCMLIWAFLHPYG